MKLNLLDVERATVPSAGSIAAAASVPPVLVLMWLLSLSSPAHAVDGVIELNEANASSGTTLHVISSPGSYRLTSDLDATLSQNGIRIDVDDVTLDLNGFTIFGGGEVGITHGISAPGGRNIEIRNGTVRDFLGSGIFASSAAAIRVIDVRAIGNTVYGINLEAVQADDGGHLVQRCTASGNGLSGIRLLGLGGSAIGNVARSNGNEGLDFQSTTSGYGENVLQDNNGGGAQVSLGTPIACNLLNGVLSCPP